MKISLKWLLFLATFFSAESKIIYYNHDLSLRLLKDGVNSFLNESRNRSEQEFRNSLKDVIALASANNTDISTLLDNIHSCLDKRVKRIESLAGKKLDFKELSIGAGLVGVGVGLSYLLYLIYKKTYQANNIEFETLKKSFEAQGVRVREGLNIEVILPNHGISFSSKDFNRLADIRNTNHHIAEGLILGTAFPLAPFLLSAISIRNGLNPHYDDKYLETYKKLRTVVNELQESIKG